MPFSSQLLKRRFAPSWGGRRWTAVLFCVGPTLAAPADNFPSTPDAAPYRHPLQARALGLKDESASGKTAAEPFREAVRDRMAVSETGALWQDSGVLALEAHPLSAAEHTLFEKKKRRQTSAKLLPEALERPSPQDTWWPNTFGSPGSAEPVEALISVAKPPEVSLVSRLEAAVAQGQVPTQADYHRIRRQLQQEQQRQIAKTLQPVVDAIQALGGEVTYRCQNSYCLNAQLTAAQAQALAERPDVLDIARSAALQAEQITGIEILHGTHMAPFVAAGFDGRNRAGPPLPLALVDVDNYFDDHVGFTGSPDFEPRILGRYACDSEHCAALTRFPPPVSDHATSIAGQIFGDLREGQDPAVSDPRAQQAKSGYAGKAQGYLYKTPNTAALRIALDHLLTLEPVPAILNASVGDGSDDPHCLGQSAVNQAINELFEQGILVIKSAGNQGHGTPGVCTVTSPGAALGAFTVGGHGNGFESGDDATVGSDEIFFASSRGGTDSAEGGGRSIIDVTAYACRTRLFDQSGGYAGAGCGTSYAASVVSAGAINFIDFYQNTHSQLVDNPGILFANLLLMGDRQHGPGGRLASGFDPLWGAGRFKMRKWAPEGLDPPWEWSTGWTCLHDQETVVIPVNGGRPIHAPVERAEAVLFWYDPRHAQGHPTR